MKLGAVRRSGMDFVSDALSCGRRVRVLVIMDDASREALATFADYSICATKVITRYGYRVNRITNIDAGRIRIYNRHRN